MRLIVGLGNPGKKYDKNRHNVGFRLLDLIAIEKGLPWVDDKKGKLHSIEIADYNEKIILVKPQSFMNDSGFAVNFKKKKNGIAPEDIYVIHDDLDIRLGEYKIQFGVGPKVHNGVNSIEDNLATKDFWRVRIGIDNRDAQNRIPGENYVLENFTEEEQKTLDSVLDKLSKEILDIVSK